MLRRPEPPRPIGLRTANGVLRHANRVSDEDEARERQLLGDGSDDTD
jgi:hypothetical protein